MSDASAVVLNGYRLRSDADVICYPDRYRDERGGRMWDTVQDIVTALAACAPIHNEPARECNDACAPASTRPISFIEARRKQGIKSKSTNLALSVVRRILNLTARLWRDENGMTWLDTPPLIQMLPVTDARKPYPLSWEEQRQLFQALPDHLARMCLFKVNAGCREQEVCSLRWDWEVPVPELDTSVFIVPGEQVKNREDRLVVLNRVARSVVEEVRGIHPEYVFTYRGKPVNNINNSAWKRCRREVGLTEVRVHDLKHTFGRRLRAAGVPLETRKVLLGHRNGNITTHDSAPELEELLSAAYRVCEEKSGKSPALVVLKQKTVSR